MKRLCIWALLSGLALPAVAAADDTQVAAWAGWALSTQVAASRAANAFCSNSANWMRCYDLQAGRRWRAANTAYDKLESARVDASLCFDALAYRFEVALQADIAGVRATYNRQYALSDRLINGAYRQMKNALVVATRCVVTH